MSAATSSQTINRRTGHFLGFTAKTAAVKLLQGVLWMLNSSLFVTNAADASGGKVVGIGAGEVDNSAGVAGDLDCRAELGIFQLVNSAASPLTLAHLNQVCYVEDNQTVSASAGLYGVIAGTVVDVDAGGVWVNVGVLPLDGTARRMPVLASAVGVTLTPALSGGIVSNVGASGAATFVLPPATPGLNFIGLVEVAQELRLDPNGTETIALPSTGVQGVAGKYLTANALPAKVHLVCVTAGTWDVVNYSGTWTAEA